MPYSRRSPNAAARPGLESLESRALPSATPLPATHFEVVAPRYAPAGVAEPVQVVALDAANHVVKNYTGTVQLSSTDNSAKLPGSFTFTTADHGKHTFEVTLNTPGVETLTATDTKTAALTGSAATDVEPAPVATHFLVVAPTQKTSGAQESVEVVALDASNHVVTNYTGTVRLSSTDAGAKLPGSVTFTAADHGRTTFHVTLETTGTQTVTATDVNNPALTGSATETVKAPAPATRLVVLSSSLAADGSSFEVVVAALSKGGSLATGYTGTVHFSSSDGSAVLPADYTFTAADGGEHVFTVTLDKKGEQTLKVTDNGSKPLSGKDKVWVVPAGFLDQDPIPGASSLLAALLRS
jgi:hypothetical protein